MPLLFGILTGFNEISIELKVCLEASWQPIYATKLNKNDTSLESTKHFILKPKQRLKFDKAKTSFT